MGRGYAILVSIFEVVVFVTMLHKSIIGQPIPNEAIIGIVGPLLPFIIWGPVKDD